MTKLKKEDYSKLFKEGVSLDGISQSFNVEKEEIYSNFTFFIEKKDKMYFEDYFKKYLSREEAFFEVIKDIKRGKDIEAVIKVTDLNNDKAFLIKTLCDYNLLTKIFNNKTCEPVENQIRKNNLEKNPAVDNAFNRFTESNYDRSIDNSLDLMDKYYLMVNYEKEQNNLCEKEMFFYLNNSDKNSVKITIGEILSHRFINWVKNEKMVSKEFLNNLDRKELAKKILRRKVIIRSLEKKRFKTYPSLEQFILDVAKQIDFKIPKNYFLKKKDLVLGNEDHSIRINEYDGIHDVPGLKYHFVENYVKDELANNLKKHGIITLKNDIIPYVESEIKDYGFLLRKKEEIKRKDCLNIIYFIRHGEKEKEAMKFLRYE